MTPDQINGAFEFLAGLMVLNHCRAVLKHREAKGVSTMSTAFFTSWGFWNIWYYPSLGQTWSFCGGLAVVAANSLWLYLLCRFKS